MESTADSLSQISTLRAQFKGALKFLTKTRLANKQPLSKLPWYILLGPCETGKTSLLAHSEQEFILAKKTHRLNIQALTPTRFCDWWATKEAVYVDVSGQFTEAQAENSTPEHHPYAALWQEAVRLFADYYQQNKQVGVIVVLNANTFKGNKDALLTMANSIKHQLQSLKNGFNKPFPIYVIINKLDTLPGFSDFFYDLSQEERAQPWGFNCQTLNADKNHKKISIKWVDEQFEQLLTKLNTQLLFRLQQQAQLSRRVDIYNFPMEMANLKPDLLLFLEQALPDSNHLAWHSVHFTSSAARLNSTELTQQSLPLPVAQKATYTHYGIKAFFVANLLHHFLDKQLQQKLSGQYYAKRWTSRIAYLIAGAIITAGVTVWAYEFSQQVATIHKIEKALTQFQTLAQNKTAHTLADNIALLDTLQQGTKLPQHWFTPTKTKNLQAAATQTYQLALQKMLLPQLTKIFSQQLVNPTTAEPASLYAALQAYLMLADQAHGQTEFIEEALISYWQQHQDYDPTLLASLHNHLTALFSLPLPTVNLNQPLIAAARLRLTSLKPVARAYTILHNLEWFPATILYDSPNQPQAAIKITGFYTKTALTAIYKQRLAQACQQAWEGNWVLGSVSSPQASDALAHDMLKSQLSDLYLSDYAHEWQRAVAQLAMLTLGKPEEIIDTLDQLLNSQSRIHQALVTINDNIQLNSLTRGYSTDIVTKLAEKFSALANIMSNKDSWQALQAKLRQLQVYLLQLKLSNDNDEAAYIAAKTRVLAPSIPAPMNEVRNMAEQLPNPWQAWFQQVSDNSWQYILMHAAKHVDRMWQEQVWDVYQQNFVEHFPFTTNVDAPETNLAKFNQFFAPGGLLDSYFIHYLKPFIDTSSVNWQLTEFDNQRLPLAKHTLKTLQQAAIIQRMFYPQQQATPIVKLSITPLAIDARIQDLQLIINDKTLHYPDNVESIDLLWPAANQNEQVKLTYKDKHGEHLVSDFKGSWSLFRFLQKGTLIPSSDPKQMVIAFNSDDNLLQFELNAQEPINPLHNDLLANFTLPEMLSIDTQ